MSKNIEKVNLLYKYEKYRCLLELYHDTYLCYLTD